MSVERWRAGALLLLLGSTAAAEELLPYARRTQSLGGWTTSIHGDVRTVGMAGASVGLADTFAAAIDNPAGLAMTLNVGDIHYASNFIRDGQVQPFDAGIPTYSAGLALNVHPWALSVGYLAGYREDAVYTLSTAPDNPAHLSVLMRQIVISGARVLADNRLSIGVTLVLAQAARAMEFATPRNVDQSYASYTAGAAIGAMVRLPKRFLVGASFSLPMRLGTTDEALASTPELPGLFQPVEVPWRLGLGLAVIPNRFLRADLSLHLVGQSPRAALLRDDNEPVGQKLTVQPRLGVAYVFADYRQLKGTLFLGTYYEATRVSGAEDRVHGSAGLEARLWVFTVGGGLDLASHYRDYLFSLGVDVFEIMARLDMIPTAASPPRGGLFPRPDVSSDAGLPRPLVDHWNPKGKPIDPVKATVALPGRIEPGLRNAELEAKKVVQVVVRALEPAPDGGAAPDDGGKKAPSPVK